MAEAVRLLVPAALAMLVGVAGLELALALAEALALADGEGSSVPSLIDDEGLGVPVRDGDDVPVGDGVLKQLPLQDEVFCPRVVGTCEPDAHADAKPLAPLLTEALES